MSVDSIHLRKLLCYFGAEPAQRLRMLRQDARTLLAKEAGEDGEGGDFHVPFWADAKSFAHDNTAVDLRALTAARIAKHPGRQRLYPKLQDGFLKWWTEKRRWRNEEFKPLDQSVHGTFPLGAGTVKVDGSLAIRIEGGPVRIVYGYFSEDPAISEDLARVGLWGLTQALSSFQAADFRILDVMRSRSFAILDAPLRGDEGEVALKMYNELVADFEALFLTYKAA